MCLDTVDKKTKKFEYGWKHFVKVGNKLLGGMYTKSGYKTKGYPVNKWISDVKRGSLREDSFETGLYPRGFHFYKTKEEAERSWLNPVSDTIKKIKVRNVVASGTQDNLRIGVAKEMFILE